MSNKFILKQCSIFPADSESKTLSGEFGMLSGKPEINYYESITSPSISVDITFLDVDGSITARGVYGGEGLAIKAEAAEDVDLEDLKITIEKHELVLNSLINVRSGVKQQRATLQFVSKDFVKNEVSRVNQRFTGNITDIVEKIVGGPNVKKSDPKGIQTSKKGDFERATNKYTFVGNREKSFDVVQKLQPKTASEKDFGFLFFENADGYHFKSIKKLLEQEPEFTYEFTQVSTTSDFVIDDYRFNSGSDLTMNLKAGTYCNETIYLDLNKMKVDEPEIFKISETENLRRPPKIPNDVADKPSRIMFRVLDVGAMQSVGTATSESVEKKADLAIYQNKSYARTNLLFSQSLDIKVSLNPALRAGQTILVRFPFVDPENPDEKNEDLGDEKTNDISGKYLISKLRHEINGNKFDTHLSLIRDVFTPENA
tara:strand:- start:3380 stop:4663 length:1284 start_codon:yes stop_codon:yes gene_type:complete